MATETKRKKTKMQQASSFLPDLAGLVVGTGVPPMATPFASWLVEKMVSNLLGRGQQEPTSTGGYPFVVPELQPVGPFPVNEVPPPSIPLQTGPITALATRGIAPQAQAKASPSLPLHAIPRYGPIGASSDFGQPIQQPTTPQAGTGGRMSALQGNAGTLLPILGLLGLAALAAGSKGKGQKPAGRSPSAGSLERGQTLTMPREGGTVEKLLQAAPSAISAYSQIQEGKKQKAAAQVEDQQRVALVIAKGMAEGWMTPEMADALGASAGIPSASQLGGPNQIKMFETLSRTTPAGAAALGIELPQKEDTSQEKWIRAIASDDRRPKNVRAAASKYLAKPGPETLTPLLDALESAPQRQPASTGGGGGNRGGAATVNQQILSATRWGIYIPGPLSEADPAMVAAIKVGTNQEMTPDDKLKLAGALSRIGYQTTMATGQQVPDITNRVLELARSGGGLSGAATSAATAAPGQRTQADYATKALDIRSRGFTQSDVPDIVEKLVALGFDPKNPTIQSALQSLPE